MFQGLRIGVTGMNSSQRTLDNVADQVANSDTNGYKKKEVRFQELLRNEISASHVQLSDAVGTPSIGAGSRPNFSKTNFSQGIMKDSDSPFHMALEGSGFFGIVQPNGQLLLTRNGAFQRNADGEVTDELGNALVVENFVPQEAWGDNAVITISSDGLISSQGEDGTVINLGRITLFQPQNYDALYSMGENRFLLPEGENIATSEGGNMEGFGLLRHKMLEGSNVDIAGSFTEMILTQRAYQMNAKSVTTADEMLEVINTII